MADLIEKIVKVLIDRKTMVPTMKSFNEHLIVDKFDPEGITPVFDAAHRVRVFGDTEEILEAGFSSTSYVYRAAVKQYSQSPHIAQIHVGIKLNTDASWADTLTAIKNQNNDWYALSTSARTMADQQAIAQWVEANEKLTILLTGDSTVVDEETGDIAAWTKLNNLDRSIVFYHPDAGLDNGQVKQDDPLCDCALFGLMLTKHPGSPTWKFKSLKAVPTFGLTTGQFNTATGKNAFVYCMVSDVLTTFDGKVASGEFVDVIHGCDWLKARVQNKVFTVLVQTDKVPFTDGGIEQIAQSIRAAMDEAVTYEILDGYEVTAPTRAEVPEDQRAKRNLPNVKANGPLAGAVHSTEIRITVAV
jgi:hypothetical protein